MSDDEAFLHFKLGDSAPNPWNFPVESPPRARSPPISEIPQFDSPQKPTNSLSKSPHKLSSARRSDDYSTEEGLSEILGSKLDLTMELDISEPHSPPSNNALEATLASKETECVFDGSEENVYSVQLDGQSHPTASSSTINLHTLDRRHEDQANAKDVKPTKAVETHKDSIVESADNENMEEAKLTSSPPPQYKEIADGTPRSVHFETFPDQTPSATTSKAIHSRSSSHIEYFQGPTGEIEKRYIDDASGLPVEKDHSDDESWEPMATVGSYEVYDDKNNIIIQERKEEEDDGKTGNAAASGYTRVANNDDANSITSLDDKTDFLFDAHKPTDDVDAEFQMAATKSMLTDQQKIAYAGLCRLTLAEMANKVRKHGPKASLAVESLQKWGTKFILSLYNHLGLDNEEQLMIESLAAHNLLAEDLTPCLKQIQKVTESGEITQEVYNKESESFEPASTSDVNTEGNVVDSYEVEVDELHEDIPTTKELNQSLEVDVKWTIMCDLFLILLVDGEYDSRARTLLTLVACKLGVTGNEVAQFERKVTDVLQIDDSADQDWTEEDIIENRRRKALRRKYAYVGLATVGGGLVIGLSGGLLAPLVGAGLAGALGTIGIAGTSGFLAGVGGSVIITTASTAIGAHVGSKSMLRRVGHVKTFEFRPIYNNNRANLVIAVSGWMTGKDDDVRLPFSTIDPLVGDVLSVLWEPQIMRSLGQTINILATEALTFGVQQILAATVFSLLMASLTAPMWLSKLSYLVDNPWSISLDRAWAAGLILADTLITRKLGQRPATLVGYSLGARVIYSCIAELSRRKAYGLIQDVYIFGTPVFYNKKQMGNARSVVSGRFVNGYSRNDWILAFLFPAARRYGSVLGLDAIPEDEAEQFDIENMDVSEIADGHMSYRSKVPLILKECGWPVLSEEFDEIEDPDPEHTREKQLKLLNQLENADAKPKKGGIFSSWGFDWMQRAKSKSSSAAQSNAAQSTRSGSADSDNGELLFDVDAIRNEMETLKPRMVFEQEPMPLPEQDEHRIPLELLDVESEVSAPKMALDYDDPGSPRPPMSASRHFDSPTREAKKETNVKLQFDDLE